MLTFKEYISESGDSSYEFHKISDNHKPDGRASAHRYSFKDNEGNEKHVDIVHRGKNGDNASVSFHDEGSYFKNHMFSANGKHGHKALRVFSTVKTILAHHTKEHPHLDHYKFSADKDNTSRSSLYTRMAKRMGGHTEDHEDMTAHVIPAKNLADRHD